MTPQKNEVLPEHMQPWTRNERLYQHLKAMGLFVTAVPFEDDRTKISYITVSSVQPCDTLEDLIDRMRPRDDDGLGLPAGIGSPMKRPEVRESVGAALGDGDNVVDFPPVL